MDALLNIIAPVFGIMAAGFIAGRYGILGAEATAVLNRFVFFFALPPLLFVFMARAPIENALNWNFIGAFVGGCFLTLLPALLVGRLWFGYDPAALTIHGLTAVSASTALMGIPLMSMAYGAAWALPAIIATVAINLVFLSGSIVVLEALRGTEKSVLATALKVGSNLLRNPLVLAPFLGLIWSYLRIPLPQALGNLLSFAAAAAGPTALFAIGLSLVGRRVTGDKAELVWIQILKLLIQPALTFALVMTVFPLDNEWTRAVIILSALPVATFPFIIAQQYEVHPERVSAAILVSTALSVITISYLLVWFATS